MKTNFVEVDTPPPDAQSLGVLTDTRPQLAQYRGRRYFKLPDDQSGVPRYAILKETPERKAAVEKSKAFDQLKASGLPPGMTPGGVEKFSQSTAGSLLGAGVDMSMNAAKAAVDLANPMQGDTGTAAAMATSGILALSPEVSIPAKIGLTAMAGGGGKMFEDVVEGISAGELKPRQILEHTIFSGGLQGLLEALPYTGAGIRKYLTRGEADKLSSQIGKAVRNEEFFQWAKGRGIHIPMTEMAGGGRVSSAAETLAGWSIPGLIMSGGAAKQNLAAVRNLIPRLREAVGPQFSKLTDTDLGNLVLGHWAEVKDKVYTGLQDEFENLWKSDKKMRVVITENLKKDVRDYRSDLTRFPGFEGDYSDPVKKLQALGKPKINSEQADILKFLMDQGVVTPEQAGAIAQHRITPPDAQKWRKLLRDKKINAQASADKTAANAYEMAEKTIDQAMKDSFARADPQYRKQWEALNKRWSQWANLLEEHELKGVETAQRENIGKWLAEGKTTRHELLQQLFVKWGKDEEARDAIRRGYLNQLIADAQETGNFNINALQKKIQDAGPETVKLVFGQDRAGRVAWTNLVSLGEAERRLAGTRLLDPQFKQNQHWIIGSMISSVLSGVGAFAGRHAGLPGMIGGAMVPLATQSVLAAIVYSPRATRLMVTALEAVGKNRALALSNTVRAVQLVTSPQVQNEAKRVYNLGMGVFRTNDVKNVEGAQ